MPEPPERPEYDHHEVLAEVERLLEAHRGAPSGESPADRSEDASDDVARLLDEATATERPKPARPRSVSVSGRLVVGGYLALGALAALSCRLLGLPTEIPWSLGGFLAFVVLWPLVLQGLLLLLLVTLVLGLLRSPV